ncbi:unnamed protein product [Caenorhabditis auriculariae]|uniref:Uncharacterized protein n=1 Tax=Caenorhabditis auriculariae TaxID=2777116 RepID=A0A8S1HEG1_9PELO|nr:unnamed protein product [Caenorhabditis auriculariae]
MLDFHLDDHAMFGKTTKCLTNFYRQPQPAHNIQVLRPNIYDPKDFPLSQIEQEEKQWVEMALCQKEEITTTTTTASKAARAETREEGYAPIRTALSVMLNGLLDSKTTLGSTRVTLFNFHATTFAERLINNGVSSLVIVESAQSFSKAAKSCTARLGVVAVAVHVDLVVDVQKFFLSRQGLFPTRRRVVTIISLLFLLNSVYLEFWPRNCRREELEEWKATLLR